MTVHGHYTHQSEACGKQTEHTSTSNLSAAYGGSGISGDDGQKDYGSIEIFDREECFSIETGTQLNSRETREGVSPLRMTAIMSLVLLLTMIGVSCTLFGQERKHRIMASAVENVADFDVISSFSMFEGEEMKDSEHLKKTLEIAEQTLMGEVLENDVIRCSCPYPGAPSPFNNYICYPPAYNAMCAPNEVCKEMNIIQVNPPSAIHLGYFMCTDHVCTEGATCTCASPGGNPGTSNMQSNCFSCKNPDGTPCINYVLTGINQCCPESHICASVTNVNRALASNNANSGGLCLPHR